MTEEDKYETMDSLKKNSYVISNWFRVTPPKQIIDNPIPKTLMKMISDYAYMYKSKWSVRYRGKGIRLSENGKKADLGQSFQSVRASAPFPDKALSKLNIKFLKKAFTGTHIFIGIISDKCTMNDFNKRLTLSSNLIKYCYGLDDKQNMYYLNGKRVSNNNFPHKNIIQNDIVKLIADFRDYKEKNGRKLKFEINNKTIIYNKPSNENNNSNSEQIQQMKLRQEEARINRQKVKQMGKENEQNNTNTTEEESKKQPLKNTKQKEEIEEKEKDQIKYNSEYQMIVPNDNKIAKFWYPCVYMSNFSSILMEYES